jgi:GlcNAc-P-P-Und epimerase
VAGRRVLITGGSGFIGSNVVEHYGSAGDTVLNLDPAAPRNSAQGDTWTSIDPLDAAAVRKAFADFSPTHVFHLGARTDLHGETLDDYRLNTDALRHVIAACEDCPYLERVVFASSRMVCRIGYQPAGEDDYCPPNAYGESKMQGELIVRDAAPRFDWMIVRPTSIWGPWFDVPYKTFFKSVAAGRYVNVKGYDVAKQFGFVGNSVHELDVLMTGGDARPLGRTFYLADYPPIRVHDMAERIRRELGARPIRTVPMALLRPAAKAGDLARSAGWSEPPLTSFRLDNLVTEMLLDTSMLEDVVGELPYDLDEGIRRTVAWMRAHGEA